MLSPRPSNPRQDLKQEKRTTYDKYNLTSPRTEKKEKIPEQILQPPSTPSVDKRGKYKINLHFPYKKLVKLEKPFKNKP